MLIVGAFPAGNIVEHGGILTSCRVLLASSLPSRVAVSVIDSSLPALPPPPRLQRTGRAAQRILLAVRHFMFARPDVILLFASPGASFLEKSLMAALARVFGIRSMMFPRGAALLEQYRKSTLHRAVLSACFRVPDVMLCQGATYRDFFINEVGLPAAQCPVLPNWTATPELLEIGAARRAGSAARPPELLFLGWVDREKGVFELLDAVQLLVADPAVGPFRLVMAGDGAAMGEVRRRVVAMDLSDTVQLLGWIDSERKLDRLRRAELLVLPSYVEGMPNSVIEAMAAGLPVVATGVGAVRDAVTDGVNGLIVAPRDAQALVAAVRQLLRDVALRRRMGHAGWQIAKDRFDVESAVDTLVALAQRLRAGQSPRKAPT